MAKRFMAVIMVVLMLLGGVGTAQAQGVVHVSLENTTYSKADGAPWEGALLHRYAVALREGDTMQTVLGRAFAECRIEAIGVENGYISSIAGISAGDADLYSGWMVTLNDWFTNLGINEMAVSAGDEIKCVHSCDMGADVGSDWSNNDTSLKALEFSEGAIDFSKETIEYNLVIGEGVKSLCVYPVASNKNYQVRTYKNTTEYGDSYIRAGEEIDVKVGDVLYIACGLEGWPSMNATDGGTVYKVKLTTMCDIDISGGSVTIEPDADGGFAIISTVQRRLVVYAVSYEGNNQIKSVKTTEITAENNLVRVGKDFDKLMILDENLVPYISVFEVK